MNGSFNLSEQDFQSLIICSVRYAVGRMTYIPSEIEYIISRNLNHLTMPTVTLLKRDINMAIDRNEYGMECDLKTWKKVLNLLSIRYMDFYRNEQTK